jgi:peptide/nickel transport system substrate-binding protein
MKMRRKTGFIVILIVLLVAGVILGQGVPSSPTAEAQDKHVLKIGILREVESLNPMVVWSVQAYEVMHLNYSLLITWDEDLNTVPNLAKAWSHNEDGTVWTFNLEEGVKWHDGEPFTSEDVKFTFEYMRDNELGYFTDYVDPITEIDTPDVNTVVLTFEEAQSWMPNMWVPIVPKHIWEEVDPEEAGSTYENLNAVGTGPFQTVEYRKGEFLRMAANPDYFKGAPQIDEIIFVNYANAPVMAEALKLGEVDIITEVPGAQFKSLLDVEGIVALEATSPSFSELAMNVWDDPDSGGNPLLLDRNVRIAIEHAINRQHMIDAISFGYGEPGTTLVPPIYDFWHLKLPAAEIREFNPEKARQILEDAGYKDDGSGVRKSAAGEPLAFSLILRSESPESVSRGTLIKEWLTDIGMDITIEVLDDGALTDRIYDNADFDMFTWGWYVDVDPASILRIMTTDQIFWWNDCFYSNPKYDALYSLQQTQLDPAERRATVLEMQRIIYEDAPYVILVYDPELQAYRSDKFEGWVRTPDDGAVIFTHSIKTYENLRPVTGGTPLPSEERGTVLPWLLGAAAVVLGFFLARRKKQQTT